MNDNLSLNNTKFGDYVERIYPIELDIKDTKDIVKPASHLYSHLEIDNEKIYDKRNDLYESINENVLINVQTQLSKQLKEIFKNGKK